MKKTRYLGMAAILAGIGLISGCQSLYGQRQTDLDGNWGRSYLTARYVQALNPEPIDVSEPVTGMQGRAGQAVMETYYGKFSGSDKKAKVTEVDLSK